MANKYYFAIPCTIYTHYNQNGNISLIPLDVIVAYFHEFVYPNRISKHFQLYKYHIKQYLIIIPALESYFVIPCTIYTHYDQNGNISLIPIDVIVAYIHEFVYPTRISKHFQRYKYHIK